MPWEVGGGMVCSQASLLQGLGALQVDLFQRWGGKEQGWRQGQKQSSAGLHEAGDAPSNTDVVVVVYAPRQGTLTDVMLFGT